MICYGIFVVNNYFLIFKIMKKYLLFIFLVSSSLVSFSQVSFIKGYYLVNSDTVRGYVEERESYLKDD